METLNHDAELPLTKDDCLEYLGAGREYFIKYTSNSGQRIGQAWVNALDQNDYRKISGSLYDPFYRDDWLSVIQALQFLLEN